MVSFSQNVTVSIENLKANNVTVPNGSPIDMGNDSSINVTFRVDLAKDANYTIGPAKVWISVFNSSGNRTDHFITTVPESELITGASSPPYDFNILDSEIDFGNGNYLMATLKQDNQPGADWDSQQVQIIKTPAFELLPSSLSLPCDDTSSRTFTLTNGGNLSGVTYQWNIGNGWTGNVGNGSSITLTPNSGTSLPSDVSVTPIYNGENQPTLTCNVNRSAFTTQATIFGRNVCSTTTYSVINLSNDEFVTSWNVSDSNIAIISENGNQATLTTTGNGTITVSATLENSCGQTKTIEKTNIYVGAPSFPAYPAMSGDNNPMVGEYKAYSVTGADGASNYTWYFDVGNGVTGTNVDGWEILSYGYQNKSINVRVGNPGTTVVVCKATNSCGNRIKYKYVTVRSQSDPCGELRLSSNPMKSGNSTNRIIYLPIDPCDDPYGNKTANSQKTVEIFNQYGEKIYSQSQTENEFYVNDLKKGFYIVKSQTVSGKTMTEKLIVE
ncbi:MAG: T9SS type A sorting domain-containing protein [Xanthomarina gelatinilytica]|uniref:T9SS type A sorting domain-containing protein n=1 Tax=Xanthomarina gelatinilytica TaxID=1137281 RepID=UPI003A87BD20